MDPMNNHCVYIYIYILHILFTYMTNYFNANLSLFTQILITVTALFLSMLSPNQNKWLPHKHNRHWWYVYYFTRFHRVMCTEVHVSCVLYATESSSSSCSNSGDMWSGVFGILKSISVQFAGVNRQAPAVSDVEGVQAHMYVHFKLLPNSF